MPFISEAASALKGRFGFHNRTNSDSHPPQPPHQQQVSTPSLQRSASVDVPVSAVRKISDWEDESSNNQVKQSFEFREDPSFWKDHNVQVIIRIRPLSSTEISTQGNSKCVRQESSQMIAWTGHPESRFTFDLVADETVNQERLFKAAGVPMVENCMEGYNSCMFAYGQTGSGKTHTMLGDIEEGTRRHSVNCGMTPRVFEYLFSRIQKEKEVRKEEKIKFICKCSFLEIYNEQILDLLDPSSANLQIREDNKKGIYVENIKEIEVASARDVVQQLFQGAANRKVASTNMNRASSRSHSVFTCIIESKWESQGIHHHRFARLNLVDLAGSERQKSSGAEGERLKEATNINKSLSTLGLVIMNLVSISNGKSLHVPYRDSKLTFLLQDSLGGNSKTIIIANISPSSCCSLETLSTLKFAQRAKFIKNNAIVNEDASGDVIAMRMQIQQLKKEVSRLQAVVNGGAEYLGNESSMACSLESPGLSKWEELGMFTPLTSVKKMSQKKDYEVALVDAFKREKDKDIALQALAAENQASMQLAKQREDEIKSLKMRLGFREAAVKRLESVVSGEISAETHLLKEKEEHVREIETLRKQVGRNQEVTRFAMENLRLKEEIRRLKAFCEDGEREMMKEQISVLQNKLLEALDWKLMHQSDPSRTKGHNTDSVMGENGGINLFGSSQEQVLPSNSLIVEENEFLRVQAIQNKAEMDTLRKKLELCLEEKQKLERELNDLVTKLEEDIFSRTQHQLPVSSVIYPVSNSSDQMELKTMVDVIGAASQREAEAHETAIKLSKENEELRIKIKVLIEDNNKLIELYERAAAESSDKTMNKNENSIGISFDVQNSGPVEISAGKDNETGEVVEKLETQLMELHEENDKLMNLYERAMQERDEFKRMLSVGEQTGLESPSYCDFPERLIKVDGEKYEDLSEPSRYVTNNQMEEIRIHDMHEENPLLQRRISGEAEAGQMIDAYVSGKETNVLNMSPVRKKLHDVFAKLQDSSKSATLFSSMEKAAFESARLSREIEKVEVDIQSKQQQFETYKALSSGFQDRIIIANNKLSALKYSIFNFSSSISYFDMRVARARTRFNASESHLSERKGKLAHLQASRDKMNIAKVKIEETEIELRKKIGCLKLKLEEEKRKEEKEKILFAIDNVEKENPKKKLQLTSATDLLKSEEEKPKLQAEIKLCRERLEDLRKELEDLKRKSGKLDKEIETVQMEIAKGSSSVNENEHALHSVVQEKEILLEMMQNGKTEFENLIVEYQQFVFEADLKEAEVKILNEELQMECRRKEELHTLWHKSDAQMTQCLESTNNSPISEWTEEKLQNVQLSVIELKSLLGEGYDG